LRMVKHASAGLGLGFLDEASVADKVLEKRTLDC
jgi:hypothetical protein